jgi:tetraprenyl-beta-curcumene synthase
VSVATHSSDDQGGVRLDADLAVGISRSPSSSDRLGLAGVFADTVLRYLLAVLPPAARELSRWRERALAIPDANLRRHAVQALGKRGNIEGAALFATLAPAAGREATIRALIAFQTAYNYLDTLSEQPSESPAANADQLHQALLIALAPGASHADYYAQNPERADGGFLTALVDGCRDGFASLPSHAALAPATREAAARIVDFQALNLTREQGGHEALRRWAGGITPQRSGLRWWETAAAAGSSLSVHALIAAAARPYVGPLDAREIDAAYFPYVGGLHSLLDSLVDTAEDHELGQPSLLGYYDSSSEAALRLGMLASRARAAVGRLQSPDAHRVILTAMCSYYLSAPQCDGRAEGLVAERLGAALGLPLSVATGLFRARRLAHTLTRRSYT